MIKKVLPIIFIIAITITGCDGSQQSPITPLPDNSSHNTTTPSTTPSIAVSTVTSMASPTAPPTLSPEQAQATILEWLENNRGCRFPCIWGLEPEETTVEMRRNLVASFGQVQGENFVISRRSEDKNPGGIGYAYQSDSSHHLFIHLDFYEEGGRIKYLSLFTDSTKNDIRIFDDADYKRLTHYYSLGQILINYGPPSDIYLATWPHDPFAKRDYEPFIIVLIYTELGFRVEYVFKAEKLDDQIIGCPADSVLTITTWQPKADISLQEIATIGIGYEFNKVSYKFFKPIDEVTSMNIDDFYQSYAIEDATECITTPSEIWYSGVP
jgi:hypothetical protein